MKTESIDAMAYALETGPKVTKIIAETAWNVATRELRKRIGSVIREEAANASANTGYGKAQRIFANRLIARIERES